MTKLRRQLIACSAVAGMALLLAGCEDSAAKARDEVQDELTGAAGAFQTAVLTKTGAVDEAGRTELRSILNRLSSATSNAHAGAGQKASASLLAADVHRLLADSQLSVVDDLRRELRNQRLAANSMVSAAERLNAIASALETDNVEEQLAALAQERSAAEEALRQEQAQMAQVDTPLSQLETKIGDARQQLTGLRTEENQLRREASELGHWQGFPKYEEAIAVRKQADAIETSSSYDELERDYQYTPTREMHEQRIDQIESAIESIDLAAAQLRENSDSSKALGSKTRQDLDVLTQRINEEMNSLVSRMEEELKPAVESAAQDLSAAATKAQQAGNAAPAGGNSARLTAAAASNSLGQLQAAWAFEQEQYAAILQRLEASGIPGAAGKYRANIEQAEAAKSQAIEAAVSALNDAASSYQRISGGNSAAVMALQHDVEARIAALTGQPAPEAPVDASMPAAGADMTAAASGPTSGSAARTPVGAASAEALADEIRAMNTTLAETAMADYIIPFDHVNFESPVQRAFAESMLDVMVATRELADSMQAQFGVPGEQAIAPVLMVMSAGKNDVITDVTLGESTGDTATITVVYSETGARDVTATQVNGRWYIGSADNFEGGIMGEEAETQLSNPGMAQMATQMANTMTQMLRKMNERVQAGEFSTIEQAQMALAQAMRNAFGGMMPQQ
jgi:regulator of replication initiation timing